MTDAKIDAGVFAGHERPRQTAHEFVRDTLRRAILSGELPSGTRLVQSELAEMLEVSTTPVREALRDLAAEGLVRLDAHRGGVVHELSAAELDEIYEIRRILEPEAIRMAVEHITDEEIDRLEALNRQMMEERDSTDFLDENREFHLSIYDSIGSPRLVSILQSLLDASVMYVSTSITQLPELQVQAVHDHREILEALRTRDADKAAEAILEHMRIPQRVFPGAKVGD